MWIFRGIILLVGFVGLSWLGTRNAGTRVTFHFFTKTFVDVELNVIMLVTFISGMIAWAIGAWIREAQLRLHLVKERKLNKKLKVEISDLRTLPLEDDEVVDSDPVQ
ncbi:MAG: DUF1049 domain-containing protein [Candidatus Krumholzibacteria bacterium]|nr:DUF1049 domain-containing protein [Candidatus Krumholzibacteria bacterium]